MFASLVWPKSVWFFYTERQIRLNNFVAFVFVLISSWASIVFKDITHLFKAKIPPSYKCKFLSDKESFAYMKACDKILSVDRMHLSLSRLILPQMSVKHHLSCHSCCSCAVLIQLDYVQWTCTVILSATEADCVIWCFSLCETTVSSELLGNTESSNSTSLDFQVKCVFLSPHAWMLNGFCSAQTHIHSAGTWL